MKDYFLDLKNNIIRRLNNLNNLNFYHFVKFNLKENLQGGQFARKDSIFEEKTPFKNIWYEGFYFLFAVYKKRISLIDIIFNGLDIKYSFHICSKGIKNEETPYFDIEIHNREIYINIGIFVLESFNNIYPCFENQNENSFAEYIDGVIEKITLNKSDSLIENEISNNLSLLFKNLKFNQNKSLDPNFEIRLKEILKVFIIFLYPTNQNNKKQYSVFINPGYMLNEIEVTSGGVALFWNSTNLENNKQIFRELNNEIALWSNFETINSLMFNIYRNFVKSAVAAIMARNLSHNIGSHVLTYLKDKMGTVQAAWDNHLLEFQPIEQKKLQQSDAETYTSYIQRITAAYHRELHETDQNYLQRIGNLRYEVKIDEQLYKRIVFRQEKLDNVEAPFLLGLSRFLGYLQERQDFIATISTDYIPYNSSVNFKEFIYDELNWDYKIQRHHNLLPHNAHNILLDNIARSEELTRHRIHIWFRNFNGIENETITRAEHADLSFLRTIDVDIPGGIIGRQALFSIIENIVRNSAKHGLKSSDTQRSFILTDHSVSALKGKVPDDLLDKITETDREKNIYNILNIPYISANTFETGLRKYLENEKWDNYHALLMQYAEQPLILQIGVEDNQHYYQGKDDNHSKEASEYWRITITDNNWNGNKAITKLEKGLQDRYVDDTGKLLESNKGLKEMRISAAWLRNEFVYETDENNPELQDLRFLNIDRVHLTDEGNITPMQTHAQGETETDTCLRYTFYIRKAKTVAVVTPYPQELQFTDTNGNPININIDYKWDVCTPEQYEAKRNKNYKLILADHRLANYADLKKHAVCRITPIDLAEIRTQFETALQGVTATNTEQIQQAAQTVYDYFYEQWLNQKTNGNLPWVTIVDDQIIAPETRITQGAKVEIVDGLPEIEHGSIFFRRHGLGNWHDLSNYVSNLKTINKTVRYLEETSGHNSTFRITHNEELNKHWWLKITESALTKVLIIDERICKRFFQKDKEEALYHKMRLHYKGVHIFNLVQETESAVKNFILHDIEKKEIATLSKENESLKILLHDHTDNEFYGQQFHNQTLHYDFVLIHQGLLDKIHETFDLDIDHIHSTIKQSLTSRYHHIVHSGRSKPDKIPQNTIFVLFSSLEKVLDDSKYSLTELLYSARLDK